MLRFLFTLFVSLAGLGFFVGVAIVLSIIPSLPDINALRDVRMQVPLRIYSRDLSLISEFGEKRRNPVDIAEVPPRMIEAVIAAEDDRFYQHPGVDWQGIMRAAINLIRTGEKTQGGSTITMQVARNFFLTREKSYIRKLNEILLALKIERELGKDEILELYLNKIYLGQRAYGVGAAAQVYYGTTVGELTLPQIAMIAGLPKAPSSTNPISNPQRATDRRNYVLRRMHELGFITGDEMEQARLAPISASLHSPKIEVDAPYVAEMIRQRLVEKYGDDAYSTGYRVITTIRDKYQTVANHALRKALLEYDERHGFRGAEHHFELAEGPPDPQEWEQLLQTFPAIGGLYPALVTEVREKSVSAYLTGIGLINIEWAGLEWARKYITENVRGPVPKAAEDVVRRGDVVRVTENENGQWKLSQIPAVEGGLVSMHPDDGAVLALAGGFDFNRSKFNRVTQAFRQPGSSFKPFIYSAALEAGFTASSVVNDAPVVFDDPGIEDKWRPENYSGKYYGPTRVREALIHSRNLISIRILHAIGVPFALSHLARFGFDTDELPQNLSLALGSGAVSPWQMATAYCVFANGGFRVDSHVIQRMETLDGEVVFESNAPVVCRECESEIPEDTEPRFTLARNPDTDGHFLAAVESGTNNNNVPTTPSGPPVAERVVDARNIWIMNSITSDVIKHGTGRRALALRRPDLSGKTGTTNDQRDAWFVGFNPNIVTVSWVGFDNFQPLGNLETGSRAALPMWMEYMKTVLEDIPEAYLERPNGLVNVRIDPDTGGLARSDNPDAIFEVFRTNNAPTEVEGESGPNIYLRENDSEQVPDQLF